MFKITQKKEVTAYNLSGTSLPLWFNEYFSKIQNQENLLVVCADNFQVHKLEKEFEFFLRHKTDIDFIYIPDIETLPYDIESPNVEIVSQRANAFNQILTSKNQKIVITSVNNLQRKMVNHDHLTSTSLNIKISDKINIDKATKYLTDTLGYTSDNFDVTQPGQFAIQRSVLDIFPIGHDKAFRIYIKNNKVIDIKEINLNTQRSKDYQVKEIHCFSSYEVPIDTAAIKYFKSKFREHSSEVLKHRVYKSISNDVIPGGIENFLPILDKNPENLIEYLKYQNEELKFLFIGNVEKEIDNNLIKVQERYDYVNENIEQVIEPKYLWLNRDDFSGYFKEIKPDYINNDDYQDNFLNILDTEITRQNDLQDTIKVIEPWVNKSKHVIFSLHTDIRRNQVEIIIKLLRKKAVFYENWSDWEKEKPQVALIISPVDNGFYFEDENLLWITEYELFGQPVYAKSKVIESAEINYQAIQDLQNLKKGDRIVHLNYGIGQYMGLDQVKLEDSIDEYFIIRYAESAKAYVKMEHLDLISRYSGMSDKTDSIDYEDETGLDNMSSKRWLQNLKKAKEGVNTTAGWLLKVHAERELKKGIVMPKPGYEYTSFSREFPFEITRDQEKAINDIVIDLTSSKPMDRVVCGDVGFGKTEVAMRAAFIVAQSGYQVAIMVPITLLSSQHFKNFKERFFNTDIRIAELSNNIDNKEQRKVLKQMASGDIDIVIGTHALIQKNVKFNNLGLFIIDEEHRFGVKQKEKMHQLRENLNVLSMTATPIPRTLSLSLHAIRDLSTINTAPAKRLSIRTIVNEFSETVIKEAIQRETARHGQVFFIHNRIETIEARKDYIQELFPDLRIVFAHGQMLEKELESIMSDFYLYKYDILISTTIIETGIDIPNANTILIENSNKFGLAQLHQLRGRVGRSYHQAYAYLLRDSKEISDKAEKRLFAMEQTKQLGEGFTLANYDMEIRGAGEILGEKQSGHIQDIGFGLYMRLLERALEEYSNKAKGVVLENNDSVEIDLSANHYIDPDYMIHDSQRLSMYKRLSVVKTAKNVDDIRAEWIDRFGELTENAENLILIVKFRIFLKQLGIVKVIFGDEIGYFEWDKKPLFDQADILEWTLASPKERKITSPNSVEFKKNMPTLGSRVTMLMEIIKMLYSRL